MHQQNPAPTGARWLWYLGCCCIAAVAAGLLGFLLPRWFQVESTLTRSIYYIQWIHLGLMANVLLLMGRSRELGWRGLLRRSLPFAGAGLAAATVCFLAVTPEYRVLADETNLLGSSLSLWMHTTYRNITEAYFYYDTLKVATSVLDGRPALFPFLVALAHSLFGFNPAHLYLVNYLVTAATVALIAYIGNRFGGRLVGALAALLTLSLPFFTLTATSGGYDLLNHLLLIATFWQAFLLLERPSALRLELLALTAVAAAGCRYESILTAVLPVGVVAVLVWRRIRWTPGALRLAIVPFFYVPLIWQRSLVSATNGGETLKDKPVFGLMHLKANLPHYFEFFFDWNMKNLPSVPAVSVGAVLGLLLLLWSLRRRLWTPAGITVLMALVLLPVLGCIHMAYYLGDIRAAFLHRLGILYAAPMALLTAGLLVRAGRRFRLELVGVVLVTAFTVHGLSRAGANEQGRWLLLYREYKHVLGFLKSQPRSGTLMISDRPGMYASQMYGAINIQTFNRNPGEILRNISRRLYPNVFVEQKVYYEKPWRPEPALGGDTQTETVFEIQNDGRYFIRISRIVLDRPFVGPPRP